MSGSGVSPSDALRAVARIDPARCAIERGTTTFTYAQLDEATESAAAALLFGDRTRRLRGARSASRRAPAIFPMGLDKGYRRVLKVSQRSLADVAPFPADAAEGFSRY